ncbi:MAG TPA: DUF2079 domain-containing protein [Chloroflexia bacterium]|nr:DUF2079 domain-containing protein [Chloroflexia bacterium]
MSKPAAALLTPAAGTLPARTSNALRASAWVEHRAPQLLAAAIVLFIALFTAASAYKYSHFGQGYDQVDFEQALWNTLQGRPFADSRFNFTSSIFGMDWMPLLAAFVPFYALLPSALTLFFLQIAAAAVGAWPVYGLARDRFNSRRHGLVFGLLWLLYPTLEYAIMDPFQLRVFATVALLFALWAFERRHLGGFVLAAGVALLTRTDVALVVLMFGPLALLLRRGWRWILTPTVLGLGYFLVVMTLIVPAFVHLPAVNCTGPIPPEQIAAAWPGSNNPNLGYYLHWGCTPTMIAGNLIKDPLYTLRYMVGSPVKIGYLAALLLPLAALPLLAPVRLLLALPILGMNLIAWRTAQTDFRTHYQLLITVGVVAAALAGYETLERGIRRWRGLGTLSPAGLEARADPTPAEVAAETRSLLLWRDGPLLALLVIGLLVNIGLQSTGRHVIARGESEARVAAAAALVAAVPAGAQVAASSFLAPHLLPRQYLYNFPPAPYSPYTMSDFRALDYILVDPEADAISANTLADGRTALQVIEASPEWTLLRTDHGFRLYERRRP